MFLYPLYFSIQVPNPISLVVQDTHKKDHSVATSQWMDLLDGVQNNQLQYQIKWVDTLTYRIIGDVRSSQPPPIPVGIPLDADFGAHPPPSIRSQIVIKNPVKAYRISYTNDPQILYELINLMEVKERAWAANIVVSKMLGLTSETDLSPERWWIEKGQTGEAKQQWTTYLNKVSSSLKWSSIWGYYKHITPDGNKVD